MKEHKEGKGQQRQSWHYYQNEGLYDDDDEIVTFEYEEFNTATQGGDVWFINFYATGCSHCHDLAPTWRLLAKQVFGIVNIGAVNCQLNRGICQQQGIRSYPSLILFRKGHRGLHFPNHLENTLENLQSWLFKSIHTGQVFSKINTEKGLDDILSNKKVLLNIVSSGEDVIEDMAEQKVSAAFKDIAILYKVDCSALKIDCEAKLGISSGIYAKNNGKTVKVSTIETLDPTEIIRKVNPVILPNLKTFNDNLFNLNGDISKLVIATNRVSKGEDDINLKLIGLRKLKKFLNDKRVDVAWYWCEEHQGHCKNFANSKNQITIIFIQSSGWQLYLSDEYRPADVAHFVNKARGSPLKQVTVNDFQTTLNSGGNWFIDFYSPGCPPCKSFMNVMREAAKRKTFGGRDINFARVNSWHYFAGTYWSNQNI